jgi:hypothetical protein
MIERTVPSRFVSAPVRPGAAGLPNQANSSLALTIDSTPAVREKIKITKKHYTDRQ